jgi:cyclin D1/2/4, plant
MPQVRNVKQTFDEETIERMEIFVMQSLNWRMNAVTPFSYISYFADKFNEGNPLTKESISRCTELILGTMKGIVGLVHESIGLIAALCSSIKLKCSK